MNITHLARQTLPAAIIAAFLAASLPAYAAAQTADQPSSENTQHTSASKQTAQHGNTATTLNAVTVTGNVSPKGIKQLDASYALNIVTPTQIENLAPTSTADMLKVIPGIAVQATGGIAGNNINVVGYPTSGDAHYVNVELNGSPLYGAYGLSWMSSPDLFRMDDSIKRVEAVQNGPNDIFGPGRPGATINFIQKDGTETPQGAGSVKASIGPKDYQRLDFYYGGEIAKDWYLAGGGFARQGDGVHKTSYPVNRGGQLEAILTHTFDGDNGKVSLSARHTNDDGIFMTSSPLIDDNGSLHVLDNFDPRKDVLNGRDLRFVRLQDAPGNPPHSTLADLARGRGFNASVYQLNFKWTNSSGWTFANNASYIHGTINSTSLFNNKTPPMTMSDYIGQTITSVNQNAAITGPYGMATSGTASFVTGGGLVPGNQQVLETGLWIVNLRIRSLVDNLHISKELFEGNTLTLGAYYANYGLVDQQNLGNNLLTTLQNDARLINVTLNNGAAITNNGVSGPSTNALREGWAGKNLAGYLSDQWFVGRWLFNAGVRFERQDAAGNVYGKTTVDLDGNPLTVYNNNAMILSDEVTHEEQRTTHLSWSAAANYSLTASSSAYARISKGYLMPMFDDIRGGTTRNAQEIKSYSVGWKLQNRYVMANISAFYNKMQDLPFRELVEINGQLINFTEAGSAQSRGVEADITVHPVKHLYVLVTGSWQNGKYENFGDFSGSRMPHLPKLQFRVTPTYTTPVPWGSLSLFATYARTGEIYNSPGNQQLLPSYYTIDAGISTTVGKRWAFSLVGTNLTNELGLTDGNARASLGGNGAGDVIFGRPLFGRTARLSITYKF